MTSRLDRLVTLLETGSTQLIRNTAAQQLADVQKQHPDELFNLLGRILPYLRSRSWDTRTAAARAVGLIITNAEGYDPNSEDGDTRASKAEGRWEDALGGKRDGGDDGAAVKLEADGQPSSPSTDDLLQLDRLDITLVLRYGRKLLGSAGREYEYSLAAMDPIERLQHQKKSLTSRLGLAGEYLEDDLIDESDFAQKSTTPKLETSSLSRKNSLQGNGVAPLASMAASPGDGANGEEGGLSKRQLNQLKRKNKQHAKLGANKVRVVDLSARKTSRAGGQTATTPTAAAATPHPVKTEAGEEAHGDASVKQDYFSLDRTGEDDESKIVAEFKGPVVPEKSVLQTDAEEKGLEWPFEHMCEFLQADLFDPNWEIRHGAAMALREVVRVHGPGAGRLRGKSRPQNNELNRRWLDDLACRLLCVFILDRFGDYISDSVVAPIRETVGQTLGALLSHLPSKSVNAVYRVLYRIVMQKDLGIERPIWEVCHGGMIGLRYLVAVRKDLLLTDPELMDGVLEAVMKGLGDYDDDVRAVSAATLVPIAEEIVTTRPATLSVLVSIVWGCLSDLQDDLSASTGSVMDLLAKLCTFRQILDAMKENAAHDPDSSFDKLVPRLYPFLRHTITSVRSAVLRALITFLQLQGQGTDDWVDGKALRLVFQNLLVERNEGVLSLSLQVWSEMLGVMDRRGKLESEADLLAHIRPLVVLSTGPFGVPRYPIPMNSLLFIKPSGLPYSAAFAATTTTTTTTTAAAAAGAAGSATAVGAAATSLKALSSSHGSGPVPETGRGRRRKPEKKELPTTSAHDVDGHMLQGDIDLVGADTMVRSKIYAAKALGQLFYLWDKNDLPNTLWHLILDGLDLSASTSQLASAMVIEEYAKLAGPGSKYAHSLCERLRPVVEGDRPSWYSDIACYLHVARAQCHSLLNTFRDHAHVPSSRLMSLAVVVQGDPDAGPNAFSLSVAEKVIGSEFERLKTSLTPAQRVTALQVLNDTRTTAESAVDQARSVREERDLRIRAAAAGALVAFHDIPKKPSHIIKSIMDSVKKEENLALQQRSATAIASLVQYYTSSTKRGPVDKIIGNLVKYCCVDTSETPEFHHNAGFEKSILSLRKEEDRRDHPDAAKFEKEAKAARIMRRGAKDALEQLAVRFGADLFDKVPNLATLVGRPLRDAFAGGADDDKDNDREQLPQGILDPENELGQEIVDGLSTLRALLPKFDAGLYPWVIDLMPVVARALQCRLSVIRYAAAKCFATICSVITVQGMTMLVERVLPAINDALDVHHRQGAIECIYHLIHVMEDDILPYVIFLVVPVLGRMSDSDNEVRLLATTSFATLVKLVPLEAGIPDPPGLSEELLKGRDRERKFMAQMLDARKVEAFPIPVAIKAELRPYQQDGVNWLAFLNRYNLHGILCDDMGLGKTLQTICIVASDHHMRAEEYSKSQAAEVRRLPSLIVCPPSLSGHWQQEVKQYAPFLSCVAYVGPPAERARLQGSLDKADIVVTSYDICRNDNELLRSISWNYCVLDEGHLIKNPRAKATLAVKRLISNHRLILSGTPIQNNVLELWSLFDFLMPGFLGTEKVFLDRFAKPIAASRFSKSSSREQEAGALAIEALHKQVLPFLLRRLKEEVLDDLPPKIIQNYYCDPSELQKKLFEDFTKKEQKALAEKMGSADKSDKEHIFQALQYMRRLCNSPALVVKEGHKQYHEVQNFLAARRSTIRDVAHAPKLSALRDLLVDCGIGVVEQISGGGGGGGATDSAAAAAAELDTAAAGGGNYVSQHRALVFCQMKEMLDIVQSEVLRKFLPSVQYLRLDGSVEATKRQEIVNRFNSDPSYDVLLLTTSVGGLGLNLTGADTVIFVEHDWNPQKDIQAMDRAHRIGQKKVVNVYRLITRGTLEEKILNLQRFKIDVASTVVNQQNAGLGTMDTDQLLDLFNLGETAEGAEKPAGAGADHAAAAAAAGAAGGSEVDMVDIDGEVREKGKKGWLDDLGELWDDRQYQEEYNLDSFLASMKG